MAGATGTWGGATGTWKPLSSSNLSAFLYDPKSQDLQIRFKSGRTYTYSDVPKQIADGLETASSPGRYFWSTIRDHFDYT